MQSAAPVQQAISVIHEVRSDINAYLGKQRHAVSESNQGFFYPDDVSNRLTMLQMIVGHALSDDRAVSLWRLIAFPKIYIKEHHLSFLILSLRYVQLPVKDFPPINKQLNKLIESCIEKLLHVSSMMEFDVEKQLSEGSRELKH